MKSTNQKEAVLFYMQEGHELDFLTAANVLGVSQLTARINDLRREGWTFHKRAETGKNRYGHSFTKVYYSKPEKPIKTTQGFTAFDIDYVPPYFNGKPL